MSNARRAFCERISSIREALAEFDLRDRPPAPNNMARNNSVRIIRNGLAVQAFNVFEDFVRARIAELLSEISASGVPFRYLPSDLQWMTTVDVVKALEYQFRLRDKATRIQFAQDHAERISSTKYPALQLPDLGFFHASANVAKEHYRDAIAAFAVQLPWQQVSNLCSRIGISGVPAENVFYSFAQRRHEAAHNAGAAISETDLAQSVLDAVGLALCFDALLSTAARLVSRLKAAPVASSFLIADQASIPIRIIRFAGGRYRETREHGMRTIRAHADCPTLVALASQRAAKERGLLLVYDQNGTLAQWFI